MSQVGYQCDRCGGRIVPPNTHLCLTRAAVSEPAMTPIPPIPEDLQAMFESSKLDTTMFVGSEIRQLIGRIAKLTQENAQQDSCISKICEALGGDKEVAPWVRVDRLKAEITRLKAPVKDEEQLYEDGRCQICGWPLAESFEKGCVEG